MERSRTKLETLYERRYPASWRVEVSTVTLADGGLRVVVQRRVPVDRPRKIRETKT